MKTYLYILHNDADDAVTARVVQDGKFGDTDADLSNGERNQIRSLVKRLAGVWKGKPKAQTLIAFAPASLPPAVPITSQWTWDHIVQPVVNLFKGGKA